MRVRGIIGRTIGIALLAGAGLSLAAGNHPAHAERGADTLFSSLLEKKQKPAPARDVGPNQADRVVVYKGKRELVLMRDGRVLKKYWVSLGFTPRGHKKQEGDGKTPEGVYTIDKRKPRSQFYKALHIDYPNDKDKEQAAARGVSAGGELYIHGLGHTVAWMGAAHVLTDWTAGCIALTNREMDELWAAVPDGTPIEIRP